MRTRQIPLTAIFLLLANPALPAAAQVTLLDVPVRRFEFHGKSRISGHVIGEVPGGLPEAALSLAMHANVRMCIEQLPPHLRGPEVPIEIKARNKQVRQILQLLVKQDPRYTYEERQGVIEVFPIGAKKDPVDCLNMTIPVLHVRDPWKYAFVSVQCQIKQVLMNPAELVPDPLREGHCSGASHLSRPPEKILERTFERRTVRDILSELSASAGNVAWYASYTKSPPTCENIVFGEYQPKTWYFVDPDNPNDRRMMEGLPTKCTNCHYHRDVTAP